VAFRQLPGFGDWLVCGISTQLHQLLVGFDEQVSARDSDFGLSGLTEPSISRLSFLQSVRLSAIMGRIGVISADRHHRLLTSLSRHLTP
jgi:mRNA interferase MazF